MNIETIGKKSALTALVAVAILIGATCTMVIKANAANAQTAR